MKRATKAVAGRSNTVRGSAACSMRPAVHHHHEIGQRHRLLLAVGDVDEGEAELGLDALQFRPHPHPQERVEGRERLVEEEHLGAGDEGAGERHPLLLAPRELGRQALGEVGHLHEVEHGERLRPPLGLADAAHPQAEGDVVPAVEMREQGVALEHHRGAALGRRRVAHRLGADDHVAGRDRLVPADHPQGRGLAAARGAEQAAIGPRPDLQVDAVHRHGLAVALGQPDQLDIHAILPASSPARDGPVGARVRPESRDQSGGAACTDRSITRPRPGSPTTRPSSATTSPRARVITGQPVTRNPSQGV